MSNELEKWVEEQVSGVMFDMPGPLRAALRAAVAKGMEEAAGIADRATDASPGYLIRARAAKLRRDRE